MTDISKTELNPIGILTKITSKGLIKKPGFVDTTNLQIHEDAFGKTYRGFATVYIESRQQKIPAGTYFVKEVNASDSGEILDETGKHSVFVESKQLERYKRLRYGGVRVPPTYRIYTENGKRYAVITDLSTSREGRNFIWSTIDDKEIPDEAWVNLKLDVMADDLINNAVKAAECKSWVEEERHILSIGEGRNFDFVADIDKDPMLYDRELGYFDPAKDKYSLRAVNLIEAWKVYLKLLHNDPEKDSQRIRTMSNYFWEKVKKIYGKDENLPYELLDKSMLKAGMAIPNDEEFTINTISQVFKIPTSLEVRPNEDMVGYEQFLRGPGEFARRMRWILERDPLDAISLIKDKLKPVDFRKELSNLDFRLILNLFGTDNLEVAIALRDFFLDRLSPLTHISESLKRIEGNEWLTEAVIFEIKAHKLLGDNNKLELFLREVNLEPYRKLSVFGAEALAFYQDQYRPTDDALDLLTRTPSNPYHYEIYESEKPQWGTRWQDRIDLLVRRLKAEGTYSGDSKFVEDLILRSLDRFQENKAEMTRIFEASNKRYFTHDPTEYFIEDCYRIADACEQLGLLTDNRLREFFRITRHDYVYSGWPQNYDLEGRIKAYFAEVYRAEPQLTLLPADYDFISESLKHHRDQGRPLSPHLSGKKREEQVRAVDLLFGYQESTSQEHIYYAMFRKLTRLTKKQIEIIREDSNSSERYRKLMNQLRKTVHETGVVTCVECGLTNADEEIDNALFKVFPEETLTRVEAQLSTGQSEVRAIENMQDSTQGEIRRNSDIEILLDNAGFVLSNYPELRPRIMRVIEQTWAKSFAETLSDSTKRIYYNNKILDQLARVGDDQFMGYWQQAYNLMAQEFSQPPYLEMLAKPEVVRKFQTEIIDLLRSDKFWSDPRFKPDRRYGYKPMMIAQLAVMRELYKVQSEEARILLKRAFWKACKASQQIKFYGTGRNIEQIFEELAEALHYDNKHIDTTMEVFSQDYSRPEDKLGTRKFNFVRY